MSKTKKTFQGYIIAITTIGFIGLLIILSTLLEVRGSNLLSILMVSITVCIFILNGIGLICSIWEYYAYRHLKNLIGLLIHIGIATLLLFLIIVNELSIATILSIVASMNL